MPPARLTKMNLSQSRISFLGNIRQSAPPRIFELSEILADIKNGKWKDKITEIRSLRASDPKRATELKKALPALMLSGEFSGLGEASLKKHSGIICFDFDKLGEEELKAFKRSLKALACVYAFFISPSGNGLKVLVHVKADDPEEHKLAWETAAEQLQSLTKVKADEAPKNISSKCFVSYDPELWINPDEPHCISPTPPPHNPLISVNSVYSEDSVYSGYSEHSTSHHPSVADIASSLLAELDEQYPPESISTTPNSANPESIDRWQIRDAAERELEKLPAALKLKWKNYLETRRVERGHRYKFLLSVIPALHTAISSDQIERLLMIHYNLNVGIWRATRSEHQKEIQQMLSSIESKYRESLQDTEKEAYSSLRRERERSAFRIIRDLCKKDGSCFLSCQQLGQRTGIRNQQAKRVLNGLQGERFITKLQTGQMRQKGKKPLAAMFRYTANSTIHV